MPLAVHLDVFPFLLEPSGLFFFLVLPRVGSCSTSSVRMETLFAMHVYDCFPDSWCFELWFCALDAGLNAGVHSYSSSSSSSKPLQKKTDRQ